MEEVAERENLRKLYPTSGQICPINHLTKDVTIEDDDIEEVIIDEEDDDLFDLDYEEALPDTDKILKTFDFSKI